MDHGADILAGLRDIREPLPTVQTLLADGFMAFAAGLLVALIIALLARIIMSRKHSKREAALADLEATRTLDADDRLLAQAIVLQKVASQIPPDENEIAGAGQIHWTSRLDGWLGTDFFGSGTGVRLRRELYGRERELDPERVDQELVGLLHRVKD